MQTTYLDSQLTHIITRSHIRSAKYGIDPNILSAPEESRLSPRDLKKRIEAKREFYDTARARLDPLYRLLKDTGFCIALADGEGYILYVIGDPDLIEHFKKRHCIPGYRWTERDMGTCAIGLVLEEKIPVFLPGEKMFATRAQKISNAGAPIFSANGKETLGVVSLSGYSEKMHVHTLGLVQQAVANIAADLREKSHIRKQAIQNQYLAALLESNSHGMFTVNQRGEIVQSNRRAKTLFQLSQNISGHKFSECVDESFDIDSALAQEKGFRAREIKAGKSGNSHYASMDPIYLDTGEFIGGLITIIEKKEAIQMATDVIGSKAHFEFDSILGESAAIQEALRLARIAAKNTSPVLLSGETGTGKELFAQAIHNEGTRRRRPFIAINCGAIPRELLESELFGYEEGAFTGAQRGGRTGKLELADQGTLFLDEIGDMPFDMQVKLLRVLQTREMQRVGGLRTISINIRVIAATNIDIDKAIKKKQFRSDLYYRISTFKIEIPPLRKRGDDTLLLTKYFLQRQEAQLGRSFSLHPTAEKVIQTHHWPGNIRQLENAIERAVYQSEADELFPEHFGLTDTPAHKVSWQENETIQSLAEIEKQHLLLTLDHFRGNIRQTSLALGLSRPTIYRKLKKYGITVREEYVPLHERIDS